MEYISSKNIFLLIRDTCKLIDRRHMDHGSRTGYIMIKILQQIGGYEDFELADFLMVASLHDVGAYYTNEKGNKSDYEFRNFLPHSVYGYLFMKFMTPMADKAKMILYHRFTYAQLEDLNFAYKKETEVLKLAEAVDIYHQALGEDFKPGMFRVQEGKVYSKEVLDYLDRAVMNDNFFPKIRDESYQEELDHLLEYMIYPNEEKKAFMETLMYCLGFRSMDCVMNSVCALAVAEGIGEKMNLPKEDMERLYYGTLLHDIGMLSIPRKILDPARRLTPEEKKLIETHVEREQKIFVNRMDPEVVRIAIAHHERLDGSGYPYGITEKYMNLPGMILQVADMVTELSASANEEKGKSFEEISEILEEEAEDGRLKQKVVTAFSENYEEIWKEAKARTLKIANMERIMKEKYDFVMDMLS